MALIKCPECDCSISDAAECCIHCGYPIKKKNNCVCIIDGKNHDLTNIKNKLMQADPADAEMIKKISKELAYQVGSISFRAGRELAGIILETGEVPATYDGSHLTVKVKKDDGLVHCPKCNSTAITTGQRGYSIVWGFLGAGKTLNRCAKCGYKWEPKK